MENDEVTFPLKELSTLFPSVPEQNLQTGEKVASIFYLITARAFGRVNSCTHSQMCIFMMKESSERRLCPPPSRQSRQLNKRLAPAVFPSSFWYAKQLAKVSPRKRQMGRWVFISPQKRRKERKKNKQQSGTVSVGKSIFPFQTAPA